MSKEELDQLHSMISEALDGFYRYLKDNALSDIHKRLDGIDGRLVSLDEKLDSMAEDVAKIPDIEALVADTANDVAALRNNAGI